MKPLALTVLVLAAPALAQTAAPSTDPAPVVTTDAASKTVRVNFIAGHGDHNRGLNYNGDAKGEKTLTVPLGWTVEVGLDNAGKMPHDFAVVNGLDVPANPMAAHLAFTGAATSVLAPGGKTGTPTKFTANRPGAYLILCRVGKHAQNGMYVKLNVVNGLRAATYR